MKDYKDIVIKIENCDVLTGKFKAAKDEDGNVEMSSEDGITFTADLPGNSTTGTQIEYRIVATNSNNETEILSIEALIDYVNICKIPKFPLSGDYLKEHGYEAGQTLGKKLKSLEEKWIENNFVIDKKVVEKSLGKVNEN